MTKQIIAFVVEADGNVIRTIKPNSYDHADPVDRENAARIAANVQLQRWFSSEQFIGRTLSIVEVRG